ncbi:ATP-binding cassette domain-containing protein [Streptomyces sp. NPDC054849]
MTLLEYDALSVSLPAMARPILDGISLRVAAGEVVALVGESGSGKSVTARAALGLFPAGADVGGRVCVDGTDLVGADAASLREVRADKAAMIYQDPRAAINPVRCVGDFLTEPLRRVHGWSRPRAAARAADLLGAVGLPDPARHMNQYPHELSGGMLQRVVIAAALTAEPRLLLPDQRSRSDPTTARIISLGVPTAGAPATPGNRSLRGLGLRYWPDVYVKEPTVTDDEQQLAALLNGLPGHDDARFWRGLKEAAGIYRIRSTMSSAVQEARDGDFEPLAAFVLDVFNRDARLKDIAAALATPRQHPARPCLDHRRHRGRRPHQPCPRRGPPSTNSPRSGEGADAPQYVTVAAARSSPSP